MLQIPSRCQTCTEKVIYFGRFKPDSNMLPSRRSLSAPVVGRRMQVTGRLNAAVEGSDRRPAACSRVEGLDELCQQGAETKAASCAVSGANAFSKRAEDRSVSRAIKSFRTSSASKQALSNVSEVVVSASENRRHPITPATATSSPSQINSVSLNHPFLLIQCRYRYLVFGSTVNGVLRASVYRMYAMGCPYQASMHSGRPRH